MWGPQTMILRATTNIPAATVERGRLVTGKGRATRPDGEEIDAANALGHAIGDGSFVLASLTSTGAELAEWVILQVCGA